MRFYFLTVTFLIAFFGASQGISITKYFSNGRYLFSLDFNQTSFSDWSAGNFILREYFNGEKINTSRINGVINNQDYLEMGDQFYLEDALLSINVSINEKNQVKFDINSLNTELQIDFIKFTELDDNIKRYNLLGEIDSTGRQLVRTYEEEFFVDTLHNRIESQGDAFVSERYLEPTEVLDGSGNIYNTVKIGQQRWLDHDLITSVFNDGSSIPMLTEAQWLLSTAPGIVFKHDEGYLYNSYALSDIRMCPQGFHVPTVKDIEILYNEINPYDLKVKIGNKVKYKVYPKALTPLIFPMVGTVQLAMWSAAFGLDLAMFTTTAAIDVLALSADALLLAPFAGWKTVKKQNREITILAEQYAKDPNTYVNSKGQVYTYNANTYQFNLISKNVVLPKKYWQTSKLIEFVNSDQYTSPIFTVLIDSQNFISVFDQFQDPEIKLHYNVFPLTKGHFHVTSSLNSFLSEVNGFFYNIPFLFPHATITDEDYPSTKIRLIEIGGFRLKSTNEQVLFLLLQDNGSKTFANQYEFNLSQRSNFIVSDAKGRTAPATLAGISYLDKNGISVWGIGHPKAKTNNSNQVKNELKRVNSKDVDTKTISTIRCVAD
jgi:hypothetical protein